jgi:hypothetical protein
VIAENEPTICGGNPEALAARLAYGRRDVEEELTLATVLERVTGHIPHHDRFIEEKKATLELGRR